MLGAVLVEDTALTTADIERRIANGRPSFTLSPEKGPALADIGVEDNGALLLQVGLYLSTWAQAFPGACDPADFGAQQSDFVGGAPRTGRAVQSFQKWANGRGAKLRTDGVLDPATFLSLQRVAGDAAVAHMAGSPAIPPAARPASGKSTDVPPWALGLVGALLALYLLRHELGLEGRG